MKYAPYDDSDPFNRIADSYRRAVAEVALKGMQHPDYDSLLAYQRLEALVAGTLVGLLGCAFASIEPDGRKELYKFIVNYMPQARAQAKGLLPSEIATEAN
jgi:hypothetical protein